MSKERIGFDAARFGRQPAPKPIGRPALLDRLGRSRERLTVVVAGAGAGKSTLLSAWVSACGVALLDLGTAPVETLQDVPLVVDGIDELPADSPLLPRLASLCTTGTARLVLASRDSLPFDAGPAQRLGEADLAFAEDETYQVLAAAFGDAAAADALAPDLHLLTNGWPALVGLAAAWLAQQPASERAARLAVLARVSGSLQDHLVGAVLDGLSRDDRDLVQRLAQLPGIDAATADRLDLTEDLAAMPPFVQPVPGRPGWFAVPRGFRDAVRRHLPMSEDARVALTTAYQGM
ncbi:hypothetical protein [Dactylosporangium fulvum]|uniref:Uncharacterized protein n=1 Tax=Dactylosporangium fulvum TaxID=53359 RepID=A0ABY5VZ18_9ACTN|nr:hypothetical protein [Dactylosporangium fulvum]UWP82983.1 hypothetical protein Dfulv_01340 [Dactylosporangium fulvum]